MTPRQHRDPAKPVDVKPVTPSRWPDLERLFGPNGAYSGCWCMFNRQTSAEFSQKAGEQNRSELCSLVERRKVPGLLAFIDGEPVGWVSVAPRQQFGRIERSPLFRTDDPEAVEDVWSVTCFFVHRSHRSEGLATKLLESAVDYAFSKGATAVEGYPIDHSHRERWDSASSYIGTVEMFRKCGFREVERRKPARPLMRLSAPRGQTTRAR